MMKLLKILTLGLSAKNFKVDISRVFLQIRINPRNIDLLGLQHKDQIYLDLSVPFGYHLGSFFFSKISDSIRYIMAKNCHNTLLNYIDDLIYCGLSSSIHSSYQYLLNCFKIWIWTLVIRSYAPKILKWSV